jgi:tRNA pseudouridine55 synthase
VPAGTGSGDGLLLVDKPAGPTSHDVVAAVRRVLGERRVGHAGTLDPAATGLLVVLAGRATRLARFVSLLPKWYRGTVRLGWETTSDDATGEPLERDESWRGRSDADVAAAVAAVAGCATQVPPRVSAKKVEGERAYTRTRRGEVLTMAAVPVAIHAITVTRPLDRATGELVVEVRCGAGTYVRSIARDLGRALGSRAHLGALRRLGIGPWRVEDAVPLAALALGRPALRPLADAVRHLPALEIGAANAEAVAHGRKIEAAERLEGPVALVGMGRLLAVAEWREGRYAPLVVLAP